VLHEEKEADCDAEEGFKSVEGVEGPQCCAVPSGPNGTRGQWRNLRECDAECGTGTYDEFYYINPNPLQVDVSDVGSGDCIFNNTRKVNITCPDLNPCPVNCVGAWHNDTSCSACGDVDNFKRQIFNITQHAAHNGTACEAANGDYRKTQEACEDPRPCNNCTVESVLPTIENGTWNCSNGTAHGNKCTGTCNSGTVADSSVEATCKDGSYTNITGTCVVGELAYESVTLSQRMLLAAARLSLACKPG
jgi:hypothetical protein